MSEDSADGLVAHPHVLRARLGGLVVDILKYFRAAVGPKLDTLSHLHCPRSFHEATIQRLSVTFVNSGDAGCGVMLAALCRRPRSERSAASLCPI